MIDLGITIVLGFTILMGIIYYKRYKSLQRDHEKLADEYTKHVEKYYRLEDQFDELVYTIKQKNLSNSFEPSLLSRKGFKIT